MIKNFKFELAYMAGIFDGEGCICIRYNGRGHRQFVLDCSIGACEQYISQLFKFHFNGNIHQRKRKKPEHQPFWQWQVMAKDALEFLVVIAPYLRLKKAEAELAIDFQKRLKWQGGKSLSDNEVAYREAQKILLSSLKKNKEGLSVSHQEL